ncbi:Radical SAM domain protein [Metallosphaera sedula]|uniref:Radical SAM domain protein n=3 Tax=Metallosphaera TaxID=41980 RepID=A4YF16_METS5|nr:Radical SAM domain protein [Metallosphaera sedula DSM 5348]AIM27004.1 Radical SAM domain protein [Metallosphaera sedula]AKV73923.1 radical SAM protein [Metallosphaera sedula]AKV76165.1 radical SAM protein [Metallosphaera sedula]AKV78416.1 radical SAM protein [Metallosphaera sedula]
MLMLQYLLDVMDRYPDLPREVVLKESILLHGISFSDEALKASYQEKAYFLFTFDPDDPERVKARRKVIPQEIRVSGGPLGLRPTVIQSRHSSSSPFKVELQDSLKLFVGKEAIANVEFVPRPSYYGKSLSNGSRVEEVAPAIYWGETADVTAYRICEYWNVNQQCKFCDINENFKAWGYIRKGIGAVVPKELVAEAIELASKDSNVKRYLITGGTIRDGVKEAEFYLQYMRQVEERVSSLPARLNTQALRVEVLPKFYEAGVDYYHPNLEVWDERLFSLISPGKSQNVGRDEWIRRTVEAVRVFGVGNVSPNFVAGIEMAYSPDFPYGFRRIEDAVKSTAEGIEYLMSRDVTPKFDTWGLEPRSWFGIHGVSLPPLEYYLELYRVYRDLRREYGMPWPRGLGDPGPGVSKVPASGFMDLEG